MVPEFAFGNVRANCSNCNGAVTTFEYKANATDHGTIQRGASNQPHDFFKLLRCAGCGRGGLAHVRVNPNAAYQNGTLAHFLPATIDRLKLPADTPDGIAREFQEAEVCASVQAWRAGSAMLRSTLEKVLEASGYTKGTAFQRINDAAADGIITAARARRAHEDIRTLGNDVLHDEWREVTAEEFDIAHRYIQRIIEDLYDDRPSVEAELSRLRRIKAP